MDPLPPIVAEAMVPLPPRTAFLAFTAHMGEWWDPVLSPDPATFTGVDIDPDGEVALRHGGSRHVWGEVTTWDPPSAYAQTFWLGHTPDHPTTLSVTFREAAEGTHVRLEHGGWTEATAGLREKYTHWDDLMTRYAAHAAR
jgi:hypothetical protein